MVIISTVTSEVGYTYADVPYARTVEQERMEHSNLTHVAKVPHKDGVVIVHHAQLHDGGRKQR